MYAVTARVETQDNCYAKVYLDRLINRQQVVILNQQLFLSFSRIFNYFNLDRAFEVNQNPFQGKSVHWAAIFAMPLISYFRHVTPTHFHLSEEIQLTNLTFKYFKLGKKSDTNSPINVVSSALAFLFWLFLWDPELQVAVTVMGWQVALGSFN